ncbi:MAG: hypothetical protein LC112_16085, partial [Flavobacteriales bacterium]|nr:hypothetical protein [Flavobacteriales bacterium]
MKKFYSLFAAVILAATINAQGTEGFESQAVTTGTGYGSVIFTGDVASSWDLSTARIIDTPANFNITGTSALMNANGTVKITFVNGIGNLKFQYRKAFTGGTPRSIQVSVNGVIKNTTAAFGSGSGAQATIYDYSLDINESGNVVVEVKVLGGQTTLDNFVWTANATTAVVDVNATKLNLVKNTVVANAIMFTTKADVQILNMNGQVVKTA